MHVQIITFNLKDTTEAEYLALAENLAPTFAAMPGLLTKVWLADPAANTYGGVYLWKDRAAMDSYMAGDIAAGLRANPHMANVTSRDYGVLDGPTRVTARLKVS
jgi:quinol monooxygenase YgiN